MNPKKVLWPPTEKKKFQHKTYVSEHLIKGKFDQTGENSKQYTELPLTEGSGLVTCQGLNWLIPHTQELK